MRQHRAPARRYSTDAGVKATFFVLGWVAERFPALVREIAGAGHEIASHGYHHQLIYWLTPSRFREDVAVAPSGCSRT